MKEIDGALDLSITASVYLTQIRKLSLETVYEYRLRTDNYKRIVIPFFDENKTLKLVKYRSEDGSLLTLRKTLDNGDVQESKQKTFIRPGGKSILLGTHLANKYEKPLYIFYGDYDCMSGFEAGFDNCVSLPFGDSGKHWIEYQFDWLEKFSKIVFVIDFDKDEKVKLTLMKNLQEMASRIGKHKCFMTKEKFMLHCKDVNEMLQKYGIEEIRDLLHNLTHVPEPGLIRLVDIVEKEFVEGTASGWKEIDRATGGFGESLMTVISGDNNAGKTTLCLNLIANFLESEEKQLYWSGEQTPFDIRWWLEQIIAGPEHIYSFIGEKTGRVYHRADMKVVDRIRRWYEDCVYILDRRSINAEEFFTVCELAVRRHGIKKIYVDNLMAFTGDGEEYLRVQGDFSESCKMFAMNWNCHVFLVTHNKKNDHFIPNKDDVEGSKKITNWADFVIQSKRVFPNEKEKVAGADGILSLCKNRNTEILTDVRILFESDSKRIGEMRDPEFVNRILQWDEPKPEEEFVLTF